jgi:hypothetical protein
MAQIVKLRRSSVPGQKPTNSNLQLGELALNTTDGKVYMAVSGSLGPSVEELISTNTVNTGSIFITGNVTASNFSGSFKGDGSQLYNIPSSGVTGLELNKIVDGSATASISQTDGLRINTKTEITGSVIIDGLLSVNRIAPLSGSNVRIESSNLVVPNGGIFTSFNILSSGSVSASAFSGSALGLINVPFQISGSDVEGNTYNKQFTKLQFDDSTGLNVSESVPGTAFVSIGSHFKDIFVSGSPILSATGSDAFEIIPTGGVEITTSITDTNGNGYVKELNISTTTLSSSLNNRMDTITGSITTLSGSVNSLNTFTSSVVLTSQTSSMNVLSASYALTAAFALNAGAGGGGSSVTDGAYAVLNQTTPATTWTFKHSLGQRYPIFQVFDSNGSVILPSQITTIDIDNATITFPSNQTGKVIASLGTGPGGLSQYFSSNATWSLAHNLGSDYPIVTIWDTNRSIIFPQKIESIDNNNIKIYFSTPVAGYVNVAKGGHIISGSVSAGSIDYIGSNLVSGSGQILITGTTGYSTFSSSISSSIGSLSSSIATTDSNQNTRLDNIETSTGSLNSFTSSINTTIKSKLDSDGVISGSIQVLLTGTTGYSTFSSSISTSIDLLSSSVAITTSGLTSTITSLSSSLSSSIDYLSSSVATTTNNLSSSISSSIGSLSSSVASINNAQNGRLDSLETESGSIRTNFNSFTSSYNTGSFTGSFKGDGTNLYNIPASGVTGLELYKIVSGSVSASISPNNGFRVNTDVYIDGILTAKEIHTDYVTSSVLYQSGSTKFGDTSDDNHLFTGSVLVDGKVNASSLTGSINFNNLTNVPTLVSGSSQIDITGTTGYSTFSSSISTSIGSLSSSVATTTSGLSSSIGSLSSSISTSIGSLSSSVATTTLDLKNRVDSIEGITGSISSLNSFTSSINTTIKSKLDVDGVISGSSQIIYSGLTGIPSGIVSSSTQLNTLGYATTGSNLFKGNQTISGSIIPAVDNAYDLGSVTHQFRDLYLSSASLYIDGTKVLGSTAQELQITTDTGQSFKILEASSDTITLQSADGNITLATSGGGDVIMDPTTGVIALKGTTTVYAGNKIVSSDGNSVQFGNGIAITGSIISTVTSLVSGSSQITYSGLTGIPSGIVSGSSQLTSSYDDRYVLSGSITQTTWDNIASKPSGIASGSSQIDITGTTGYSTFSSSISTSIGSLSGSVAITTSGLSSSIGSLSSSFATTTIGLKNRIDSIETTTGSLNTFTSSASGRLTSLETASGSIRTDFNTYTGSNDSTNTTQNSRLTSIEGITGSISSLNTYTGSNNTIIGTLQTATSSLNSYTSSNTTNINAIHTSTGSFKSFTSSFDTAFGMSGADVTVKGNLTVSGTQTIVNSTTVAIGDNIIQLNGTGATNAGLVVRDATAPNTVSGSFLWDSTNDKWIAGSLGSEDDIVLRTATQTLTNKTINASQLVDASVTNTKLANSSITIAGTSTSLGGTISAATILSGTGTVSGSSQIDLTATTNYASGILTRLNAVGVFSGSAQVTGIGNAQLTNSSFHVGTTSISLGRASASQTLTGVSIDGNAGTVTNGVYTTGDQSIAGTKTFTGTISVTASEGRETTTYMPSSYTTNDLVSGHEYGWYDDHWRLGMTRSASAPGADFVIQWNAARRLSLTSGGNLTVTGTIGATNFSGTSSGTNTGDETLARVNALAITTVGTITSGTWNGTSIGTTYTAAKVTAVNAGTGVGVDTTTGSVTVSIGQAVGTANAPTFAGGTINGSLYVNANNDVTTLAGSLTLYSSGNATSSMIMFKNTTGLGYGNHGAITGTYNTYFVMDTTDRGWIFRNATTSGNVASISNTGVISATRFTTSSGQTGTMSGNAYPVSPNSYFGLRHGSMGASSAEYMIISANADTYISCATGSSVYLRPSGNSEANGVVSTTGAFRPETNNSINLGTASFRWQTVFTMDLSLSNGIGDYTIVEGEEKLYLYNNKNNKVYSFVLQEEDPTTATPKMS